MITVIDLKASNLGSISNMLKKVGAAHLVTSDVSSIRNATKILLPGIGSFDKVINTLRELGIEDSLREKALVEKVPFMGICLGMQIMTRGSEEGKQPGLSYINADTVRLKTDSHPGLKVPHMGWNIVSSVKSDPVLDAPFEEQRFYFAHSYFVKCDNKQDILAQTSYGDLFTCSFRKDNLWGFQFHPEKSHKFGMSLFKNFSEL